MLYSQFAATCALPPNQEWLVIISMCIFNVYLLYFFVSCLGWTYSKNSCTLATCHGIFAEESASLLHILSKVPDIHITFCHTHQIQSLILWGPHFLMVITDKFLSTYQINFQYPVSAWRLQMSNSFWLPVHCFDSCSQRSFVCNILNVLHTELHIR